MYFTLFSRRKKERRKRKCAPHENVLTLRKETSFGSFISKKSRIHVFPIIVQLILANSRPHHNVNEVERIFSTCHNRR
ncbi:hypothetical protein BPUM_0779 [Bacillus pumilus SAFR-032]|uniref:Uncharacterized protein n=1 Tax=Bacillus pumilus (strain SAFR-032) TaxID=315750 RepID=A8FB46_BACP2|nr:hypothetical protein BPUM_0779 [Bacillus pumilus SAFR-032]